MDLVRCDGWSFLLECVVHCFAHVCALIPFFFPAVVRYISAKSVDRALHEYRNGEIVVQDVAVQVKVLKSEVGSLPGPSDLASPAPAVAAAPVAGTPEIASDRLQ